MPHELTDELLARARSHEDKYDPDGYARFGAGWLAMKERRLPPHPIGDVVAIAGEPPDGNPYRGAALLGKDRSEALRRFWAGESTEGVTFWYTPAEGGARRLVDAAEVKWGVVRREWLQGVRTTVRAAGIELDGMDSL